MCAEEGPVPDEYVALASDPEFRALLMFRRSWMRAAVRDHRNAVEQADEILVLVRDRLESISE